MRLSTDNHERSTSYQHRVPGIAPVVPVWTNGKVTQTRGDSVSDSYPLSQPGDPNENTRTSALFEESHVRLSTRKPKTGERSNIKWWVHRYGFLSNRMLLEARISAFPR